MCFYKEINRRANMLLKTPACTLRHLPTTISPSMATTSATAATATTHSDSEQPVDRAVLLDPAEWEFKGNVIMLTRAAAWTYDENGKNKDNGVSDGKDDNKDNCTVDDDKTQDMDTEKESENGSTLVRVEAVRRYLAETHAAGTPAAVMDALAKRVWNDATRTALGKLLGFVDKRLRFGGKVVQVAGVTSKHTRLFFGDYAATHSHHCGRPVYEKVVRLRDPLSLIFVPVLFLATTVYIPCRWA